MSPWLVDLFGLSERIPEGARVHFEWGHLPRGESGLVLVLSVVGALALTVWLYRREGSASRARKTFLAALRLLALGALLAVFLEPRLAVDLERTMEGHTVVLWDTSLSMSLSDRYQEEARRQAMAGAAGLSDPQDLPALNRQELAWAIVSRARLLEGLAARNRLLIYGFAGAPRALSSPPTREETEPGGPATDLAGALRKALEEAGGQSVAAVVAITDGRITKGEGEQGVRALLEGRGVPFYALGVGDPVPPKNLEVLELDADPRVLLGDPIAIEGRIRARGYAGQQVEAVFRVRDAAGGVPRELERRQVELPGDDEPLALRFHYEPEQAGGLVFELHLPPREEEPIVDDNLQSVPVEVSEDQTKVLLVAGSPSFEYRFLKTALIREKSAIVSCWLQSADSRFPQDGNERLEALPSTLEAVQGFDCVLLLDPDPQGFDAASAEAMKRFVADTQGGLLYVPGPKHAGSFLQRPDLRAFRELLPVVPGDLLDLGRVSATERSPFHATPDGVSHPASRLVADPERAALLWSRLPGAFFSFPVQREKAGAQVLVRHQAPDGMNERGGRPLVAAQFFAGGPVVYQGTAETWRWRSVGRRLYERYWLNLLRFLVQGRLAGGRKRVELLADKELYVIGEPIRLRAQAFDRSYRPLEVERLVAVARGGGEEVEVVLEPSRRPGQPGWYEGVLLPPAQGTIDVSLALPGAALGEAPTTLKLTVQRSDLEYADPCLDEQLLASVAAATSGALVAPGELAQLPERIPSLTERLVVAGTPIPLWDRWGTLALVALLLGLEWTIRKRSKMV